MCWLSTEKKDYRIANEDIHVYKVMLQKPGGRIFDSFYFHKTYETGQVYKTVVNPVYNNIECFYRTRIEGGFHSYDKSKTIIKGNSFYWIIKVKNRPYNPDIIHCPYSIRGYEDIVAVECVIPKGSFYYMNEDGEIVSNQIMVTGNILKRFNFKRKKRIEKKLLVAIISNPD